MRLSTSAVLAFALSMLAACAALPAGTPTRTTAAATEPITFYAYREGSDTQYIVHTIALVGEANGNARYTAALFKDGARYSLATSGSGTFSVENDAITIKAGGLNGKGSIKLNEHITIDGKRYSFVKA
jgi:hypothetical protein